MIQLKTTIFGLRKRTILLRIFAQLITPLTPTLSHEGRGRFFLVAQKSFLRISFFAALFFMLALNARAEENAKSDDGISKLLSSQQTLSFADSLFEEGDYYRAITEYKRFIFLFPESPLALNAKYKIGMSYFKGEKYKDAINSLTALSNIADKNEITKKSLFTLGEVYFKDTKYQNSADMYERFLKEYPDALESDNAKYKLGWSYLYSDEYDKAKSIFSESSADSPFYSVSKDVSAEIHELTDIELKSPTLAGSLSAILPGAGQVYCGRYQDGITAFVLNGLFIWGTVELLEDKNYAAGGVFAFFSVGWYTGNIFSAVSGAHKFNRDKKAETLDKLGSKYNISLNYDSVTKANLLVLNIRY